MTDNVVSFADKEEAAKREFVEELYKIFNKGKVFFYTINDDGYEFGHSDDLSKAEVAALLSRVVLDLQEAALAETFEAMTGVKH